MTAECVIGVDLGGTKLLAGAIDAGLEVHHRIYRAEPMDDQRKLLDAIVDAVQEVRDATDLDVEAVGFGIPALIDRARGEAISSVHLPLDRVAFGDVMAERLGLPVFFDNDANAAMLAEHRHGAARGTRNAVMLTLGTGIGGGLIINGELFRGSHGAAAELGHIVIDETGPGCGRGCPSHGCLEALASGSALVREAERAAAADPSSALAEVLAAGGSITGPLVTELAHDGDQAARLVVALIGTRLGIGIAGLINAFDPDVVVIGGGVIAAGDLLLEPARRAVAERALPFPRDHVKVVPAHFGAESGMLGAALLALDGADGRAPL
jgi:glucokinase